ncbi:hypothetical protein DICVIV_07109 [Dictyocaulus viviparus]|uniref:Uncharacterized protein n=1 Tax=Dictyocaulus viviparus TaxID=29172 RepID=A0A0D8XSV7_DICVI|nr:hypothetical protein DICVIV_07109 [Dictyocaulus viviparus]
MFQHGTLYSHLDAVQIRLGFMMGCMIGGATGVLIGGFSGLRMGLRGKELLIQPSLNINLIVRIQNWKNSGTVWRIIRSIYVGCTRTSLLSKNRQMFIENILSNVRRLQLADNFEEYLWRLHYVLKLDYEQEVDLKIRLVWDSLVILLFPPSYCNVYNGTFILVNYRIQKVCSL